MGIAGAVMNRLLPTRFTDVAQLEMGEWCVRMLDVNNKPYIVGFAPSRFVAEMLANVLESMMREWTDW